MPRGCDATGFEWEVTIPDLELRERRNSELNAAYAAATALSPLPSGRDTYRALADYEADLRQLAAQSPTLVRLITLSRRSVEGREILGVEISDNVLSRTDGKPVFLMIGLHHAREWPSGELSIEFAIDLVENFGVSERVTELLRKVRVIVVPVLNVDGFEQSRKWGDLVPIVDDDGGEEPGAPDSLGNLNKRKNCRVVDGRATPPGGCDGASPDGFGDGVDLNRNYGWLWGGRGASDVPRSMTYRGQSAFSEPETQAIRELVSSRHVTTLITNHTYSNLVLRPPGLRSEGTSVDEPAMRALGARMVAQNGYRNRLGWQLYDTTGSTESWSYNATGGFGYTFEIGSREFRPPFAQVVDEYFGAGAFAAKGNREAFLIALENAAEPAAALGDHGHGAGRRHAPPVEGVRHSDLDREDPRPTRLDARRPARREVHVAREPVDAPLGQGSGQGRALPADMRAACRDRAPDRAGCCRARQDEEAPPRSLRSPAQGLTRTGASRENPGMDTAEVVVVGGGAMGASVAWHLRRLGIDDVVLVERDVLASGSTSKSAGGFRAQFADELNIRIALRSLDELEAMDGVELHQHGYLFLLDNEGDVERFRAALALQH